MSEADDLQHRVEAFADLSIRFVEGLPHTMIAQKVGGQYLDASTSVAANYRAARHGRSYEEFTAKLGVVSEEADE
jgi:four helix bundle protein